MVAKFAVEVNVAPPPLKEPEVAPSEFAVNTVSLSFGAAKGISERMMLIRNYKVLILDITDVPRLGVTATLAIEDMVQEALNNSRKAYVAGATGRVKDRLAKFGVDVIGTRKEALTAAIDSINV